MIEPVKPPLGRFGSTLHHNTVRVHDNHFEHTELSSQNKCSGYGNRVKLYLQDLQRYRHKERAHPARSVFGVSHIFRKRFLFFLMNTQSI